MEIENTNDLIGEAPVYVMGSENDLGPIIRQTYKNDTRSNVEEYNRVAKYAERVKTLGYNCAYQNAKAIIELNTPKDAKIMDVGVGTGFIGEYLAKAGYTDIFGIDGSPEMIMICQGKEHEGKKIYKELEVCLICVEPIKKQDKDYDVICAAGALLPGHIPNGCFELFHGYLKVGGYFINSAYADLQEPGHECGYYEAMDPLIKQGKYKLVKKIDYLKWKGIDVSDTPIKESPGATHIW